MLRPLPAAALAAVAAALFAAWPVLDKPFIADDIDLFYTSAVGTTFGGRADVTMRYASRPDWFRPLLGVAELGLFAAAPGGDRRPHRLVILSLILAGTAALYALAASIAGPAAAVLSAALYLSSWCHWATLAPTINVGSAASQLAFFGALWLAHADARRGEGAASCLRWPLVMTAGILFKEDLVILPAAALVAQLAARPTKRQLRAALVAGVGAEAVYWGFRRLVLHDARIQVPGSGTQWRSPREMLDLGDYGRVFDVFFEPARRLLSAPWWGCLRAQLASHPTATSAWLAAAAALGALLALALWRATADAEAQRPARPEALRPALLLGAAVFLLGIWPYMAFVNGLFDLQRAARSVAGLALALGLPAALAARALAAKGPRALKAAWLAAATALYVQTAAAYRFPDAKTPVFVSAYMHRETANSVSVISQVLKEEWRTGDLAGFKGFEVLRVNFLVAIWAREQLVGYESFSGTPEMLPREATRGRRLWSIDRYSDPFNLNTRLTLRRADGRVWSAEWARDDCEGDRPYISPNGL